MSRIDSSRKWRLTPFKMEDPDTGEERKVWRLDYLPIVGRKKRHLSSIIEGEDFIHPLSKLIGSAKSKILKEVDKHGKG